MKRFLSLLMAYLMVCSISFAENNYDKDFDNVFNSIVTHVQKSQYVVTANLMMWQEVGPKQFVWMVQDIMKSETYDDMIYDGDLRVVFGVYESRTVFKTYKQNYLDIASEGDAIKQALKVFKDTYEDKHEDAVEALKKYYNKAIAYGEFATSPSGNLLNYSQTNTTLFNELEELKNDAEFEK